MVTIIDLISGDVIEDSTETGTPTKQVFDTSQPQAELQLHIPEQELLRNIKMPVDFFETDVSDFIQQQN